MGLHIHLVEAAEQRSPEEDHRNDQEEHHEDGWEQTILQDLLDYAQISTRMSLKDRLEVTFVMAHCSRAMGHWGVDDCNCRYDIHQDQKEAGLKMGARHFDAGLVVEKGVRESDQHSCEEVTAALAVIARVVQEISVVKVEIVVCVIHTIEKEGREVIVAENPPG